MIARARQLAHGVGGAEFVEGDAEELPFADGEFTAVICTTSLHHHPRPEASVAEMARAMAPGGRLVIGDGCSDGIPARLFDAVLRRVQRSHVGLHRSTAIAAFLRAAGLEVTAIGKLVAGGYAVVLARKA
jgi:ubiquinone/menaquinone biosynthesis C-methylase UbiE